jgi:hypothetical protein
MSLVETAASSLQQSSSPRQLAVCPTFCFSCLLAPASARHNNPVDPPLTGRYVILPLGRRWCHRNRNNPTACQPYLCTAIQYL